MIDMILEVFLIALALGVGFVFLCLFFTAIALILLRIGDGRCSDSYESKVRVKTAANSGCTLALVSLVLGLIVYCVS